MSNGKNQHFISLDLPHLRSPYLRRLEDEQELLYLTGNIDDEIERLKQSKKDLFILYGYNIRKYDHLKNKYKRDFTPSDRRYIDSLNK